MTKQIFTSSFPKQSGFTLVEALIASLIMFIAIGIFTMVFRGAIISSQKASANIEISAAANLVVERISAELTNRHSGKNANGEGKIFDFNYTWRAKVKSSAKPPSRYLGGSKVQADHTAKLWQVDLTFEKDERIVAFQFEEVTW